MVHRDGQGAVGRPVVLKPRKLAYNLATAMITVSKEDYLKAVFEAESEGKTVISATLAGWLNVSPPAVTMALRRLKRDGLVAVRKDGQVRLTGEGRRIAKRIAFRHQLIERMLSEIFGMAWYEVHDEAERLEHAVSPAFERKLVEKLGDKESCPHGNSLALMNPEQRRKRGQRLLSEAAAGTKCRVSSVYERDRKLLEFLEQKRIRPGTRLKVHARNYDGTIILTAGKKRIALGHPAAEKIWVAKAR
jgi:DtxR family transcriptional regulator, iron-dependent repressor